MHREFARTLRDWERLVRSKKPLTAHTRRALADVMKNMSVALDEFDGATRKILDSLGMVYGDVD